MRFSSLYGSYELLDQYLSGALKQLPQPANFHWQHGWIPRLSRPDPDLIIGEGGWAQLQKNELFLVARQDQVKALADFGFNRVSVFGLPFAYALKLCNQFQTRVPGSLLILPEGHYTPEDGGADRLLDDLYMHSLSKFRSKFSKVSVCLHGEDIKRGRHEPWISAGFEVVQGASPYDRSSLINLANFFLQHEFCTTNGFGSHIAYAASSGCKISIWGPPSDPLIDIYAASLYRNRPDLVSMTREYLDEVAVELRALGIYCDPRDAVEHVEWGREEIGYSNVLPPNQTRAVLQTIFRHNPTGMISWLRNFELFFPERRRLTNLLQKVKRKKNAFINHWAYLRIAARLSTSNPQLPNSFQMVAALIRILIPVRQVRTLRVLGGQGQVLFRPWSSDLVSLGEAFGHRDWAGLEWPPAMKIVDVGAGIGHFSALFGIICPEAEIYSIEPSDERLEMLRRQARLMPQIRPVKLGIGVNECTGSLIGGVESGLGLKVVPAVVENCETVSLVSLRNYLAQPEFENGVDVLRLNLAGMEYEVLRDCGNILANKVRMLIVKFHLVDWKQSQMLEIKKSFAKSGLISSHQIDGYQIFLFQR